MTTSTIDNRKSNKNSLIDARESCWIGDGGGSISVTSRRLGDENGAHKILALASTKKGTPFNVMCDTKSGSKGSFCYELDIQELKGNISVGLVRKEEFQQGWRTRGMFYNGNVTNGSRTLIVEFGDHLKQNDKVGVLLLRKDHGIVETTFYMNGTCLGTAFRMSVNRNTQWYPCIHINGEASIVYYTPTRLFHVTSRQKMYTDESYEGDWKITRLFKGPELGAYPLPEGHKVIMSIKPQELDTYGVFIKVANTIKCQVKVVGKLDAFDKIQVGPTTSTMIMPSPELQETEQTLSAALPTLHKMLLLSDANFMIMTGPAIELTAERHVKTFQPKEDYL